MLSPQEIKKLTDAEIDRIPVAERIKIAQHLEQCRNQLRQENAILYYKPVGEEAKRFHLSDKRKRPIIGGNGSSKSETQLVDIVIEMTGIIPLSLKDIYPQERLRPPIAARLIVKSLTNTWEAVIKPKLMYDHWTGLKDGVRGHFGWIPKHMLIKGKWEESWSEKYRTVTLTNGSTLQIMCIDINTPILMSDATWLPLDQVEEGDLVQTRHGPKSVLKTFRYQSQPVFKIKMWGGYELTANDKHRHFLQNGTTKTTSELMVGDCLQIAMYEDLPVDPAESLWKIGWTAIMIGDGTLGGRQAEFTAVGEDSRVINDLPPLPPGCKLVDARKKTCPKNTYRVTLDGPRRDNPLVMSLKKDGLMGKGSATKFVPEWVFRQPPEMIEKFLYWLWLTDGTAYGASNSYYISISQQLASDVQRLLWRVGKKATISKIWHQGGFCPDGVWGYHVITNWNGNTRGVFGQIRSIEPVGLMDVGCLEVEGTHEFIANGVVTGNSHDQDLTDFSGASLHRIGVDEGPKAAVWRENVMRMREGGSISIAMTPPDDESASWDAAWVFELYESGLPGPNQAPDVESFTLFSEDNPYTDKQALADMVRDLTEAQKEVRMHGHFMHLSGRIYPTYSDRSKQWCFQCGKPTLVFEGKQCSACKSENIAAYCHLIEPFQQAFTWPCIMAIDPHPRKPHCVAWYTVSPSDDIYQVAEIEIDDTPVNVKKAVDKLENSLHLRVSRRLMDPNMGESPSTTSVVRHETVKEAFDRVGLRCAMSDDNRTTAQMKIKEYLKVDSRTMQPRFIVFNTCKKTNYQMLHYSWGEWARYTSDQRDPKPVPKDKDSDFPTLLGYVMNDNPSYRSLQGSVNVIRTQAAMNRQKAMRKKEQHHAYT